MLSQSFDTEMSTISFIRRAYKEQLAHCLNPLKRKKRVPRHSLQPQLTTIPSRPRQLTLSYTEKQLTEPSIPLKRCSTIKEVKPINIPNNHTIIMKIFKQISSTTNHLEQFMVLSRQQMFNHLKKTLHIDEYIDRILDYLNFPQNMQYGHYKLFLLKFNQWTQVDILVFTFHIFDIKQINQLNTEQIFHLLASGGCFAEDALHILKNQHKNNTISNSKALHRVFQQKQLNISVYQDILKIHETQERRNHMEAFQIKNKMLYSSIKLPKMTLESSKRQVTHVNVVKDLYRDTKIITVSFNQFQSMYANILPSFFGCFIRCISLLDIPHLGNQQ